MPPWLRRPRRQSKPSHDHVSDVAERAAKEQEEMALLFAETGERIVDVEERARKEQEEMALHFAEQEDENIQDQSAKQWISLPENHIWVLGKNGRVFGYIDPKHASDLLTAEEVMREFQSEKSDINIHYYILHDRAARFSIGNIALNIQPYFDFRFKLPSMLTPEERRINAYYAYMHINYLHEQSQGVLATALEYSIQKASDFVNFLGSPQKLSNFVQRIRVKFKPKIVGGKKIRITHLRIFPLTI